MKRIIYQVILLALIVLLPTVANAKFKVGWVDINSILNTTQEGQKMRKELESEFNSKRQAIESKKKEFDKLEDEFSRQIHVLSKEALGEKKAALEGKKMELSRMVLESQGKMRQRDKELSDKMLKKITAVVTKIGVDGKYDLIMEKNGMILYSKDPMELTSNVISLYDKMHPVKKKRK